MSRLVAGHHETYILWLQKLLRNRHPYPAYSIHEAGWEEIVGGWEALVGWGGPLQFYGQRIIETLGAADEIKFCSDNS